MAGSIRHDGSRDLDGNDLLRVATGGYEAIVQILLTAGVEIDARNKIGLTTLYFSIMCEQVDGVKELVPANADVNAPVLGT